MADPSLVLDRRGEAGLGPGLHAVVIGVSDYAFLSDADDIAGDGLKALQKLESSALSAWMFAEKLKSLDAESRLIRPLKTLRLLIAPSATELGIEPKLAQAGGTPPLCSAITAAVRKWRSDLCKDPREQAVFFFSGHGIRRMQTETILLASDFLDPDVPVKLENTFELLNILGGMVPSDDPADGTKDIGREQFYFIDACRDKPDALDKLDTSQTPKIFDTFLNSLDDRAAPVFFATMPGGVAAGLPGKPTLFTQALIWALDNGSVEEVELDGINGTVWPVKTNSLKSGLEVANPVLLGRITPGGLFKDAILCYNRKPPRFRINVKLKPGEILPNIKRLVLENTNTSETSELAIIAAEMVWSGEISSGPHLVTLEGTGLPPPQPKPKSYNLNIQTQMPWGHTIGGI
jgi:Caspase domain